MRSKEKEAQRYVVVKIFDEFYTLMKKIGKLNNHKSYFPSEKPLFKK